MKKGFTLIELAIALMVIGLILAMAMKGRAVTDSAEIKSDINKVNKIASAIATYKSKHGYLPGRTEGYVATGYIPPHYDMATLYDDLAEEGLLTEVDYIVGLEGTNKYFHVVGCNAPATDGDPRTFTADFVATTNLCVIVSNIKPRDNSDYTSTPVAQPVSKFACYMDSTVDDRDYEAGFGIGEGDNGDFANCDEASDVENYSYLVY